MTTVHEAALALCEALLRLTRSDSCDTVTGCGCLRCQAFALRAALAAEPALDRETLAALAHDQWSGWMRYLYGRCTSHPGGALTIPAHWVARWQRQMNTDYDDLSEAEKESDRQEADRVLTLSGLARGAAEPSDEDVARELAKSYKTAPWDELDDGHRRDNRGPGGHGSPPLPPIQRGGGAKENFRLPQCGQGNRLPRSVFSCRAPRQSQLVHRTECGRGGKRGPGRKACWLIPLPPWVCWPR